MSLFTGSARLHWECDISGITKDEVRRLLAKRYAGTDLSHGKVMGSPNTEGHYCAIVSGVFHISDNAVNTAIPAQLLTTVFSVATIDAMFLAEPGEIIECTENFKWIRPIDVNPMHNAHDL